MQWKVVGFPFSSSNRRRSKESPEAKRGLLNGMSKRRRGRDDFSRGGTSSSSFSSVHSQIQIGEDAAPNAPWRVENIRFNGPPSEEEWWVPGADSSIEVKSIDSGSESTDEEAIVVSTKEFHNCGLFTWRQVQEAWRIRTVFEPPAHPPPVKRREVMNGLSVVARKYELPGRMTLTDVVDIYQDIWD